MSAEVWLVIGSRALNSEALSKSLKRGCDNRSWRLVTIYAKKSKDRRGKSVALLKPNDANRLYTSLHRVPIAVLQGGTASVLTWPNKDISSNRPAISIARFVRYKAHFSDIRIDQFATQLQTFFTDSSSWFGSQQIPTENDPRVLPLHVFSPSIDYSELHQSNGIAGFSRTHGTGPYSSHKNKLDWKNDKGRHALQDKDKLTVAGLAITPGHHWDVSTKTRSRSGIEIANSLEIWKIRAGGHLNIYPDAKIRKGSNYVRIWPKK